LKTIGCLCDYFAVCINDKTHYFVRFACSLCRIKGEYAPISLLLVVYAVDKSEKKLSLLSNRIKISLVFEFMFASFSVGNHQTVSLCMHGVSVSVLFSSLN
jgi:hypothetical protein